MSSLPPDLTAHIRDRDDLDGDDSSWFRQVDDDPGYRDGHGQVQGVAATNRPTTGTLAPTEDPKAVATGNQKPTTIIEVRDPQQLSRLFYCNPVCFLSTAGMTIGPMEPAASFNDNIMVIMRIITSASPDIFTANSLKQKTILKPPCEPHRHESGVLLAHANG
jgi:hypothetical protein